MEGSNLSGNQITILGKLEALLFAAPSSVTAGQLASVLEIPVSEVERSLKELQENYRSQGNSGLRLQKHRERYQLTTAPETAELVERLLGLGESSRLTRAALEALAIVAYQQPITRPHIDAIRGVSSDGVLKSLLSKGIIQEVGRAEGPGRPILYATSTEFLQYFGLSSLDELPPLQDAPGDAVSDEKLKKLDEL